MSNTVENETEPDEWLRPKKVQQPPLGVGFTLGMLEEERKSKQTKKKGGNDKKIQ